MSAPKPSWCIVGIHTVVKIRVDVVCPSSPSSPVNHTAKYLSHSELCKIQSSWLIKALFPSFPSTSLQKRGAWRPKMKHAACFRSIWIIWGICSQNSSVSKISVSFPVSKGLIKTLWMRKVFPLSWVNLRESVSINKIFVFRATLKNMLKVPRNWWDELVFYYFLDSQWACGKITYF